MTEQIERCGLDYIGDYNSNDREDVATIKNVAIRFIDLINVHGKDKRRNAIACTKIEEAAMMAVKSIFTEEE